MKENEIIEKLENIEILLTGNIEVMKKVLNNDSQKKLEDVQVMNESLKQFFEKISSLEAQISKIKQPSDTNVGKVDLSPILREIEVLRREKRQEVTHNHKGGSKN
jgi:hypothetical protein